jgi:hypothetical protein
MAVLLPSFGALYEKIERVDAKTVLLFELIGRVIDLDWSEWFKEPHQGKLVEKVKLVLHNPKVNWKSGGKVAFKLACQG